MNTVGTLVLLFGALCALVVWLTVIAHKKRHIWCPDASLYLAEREGARQWELIAEALFSKQTDQEMDAVLSKRAALRNLEAGKGDLR